MALTSAANQQIIVNKIGNETSPVSIILNNYLWLIYSRFRRIVIREYLGNTGSQFISNETDFFTVSNALENNGIVSTVKFWLWTVENKILYVTEITPNPNGPVTIGSKILIRTNVTSVSINVFNSSEIRALILDATADIGAELFLNLYPNITSPASKSTVLQWSNTRLTNFISLFSKGLVDGRESLIYTYLDVASPPNVYEEEYLEGNPPTITSFTFNYVNGVPTLCWTIENANSPVGRVIGISPDIGLLYTTSGCTVITGPVRTSYTLYVKTTGGTDSETLFPFVVDFTASVLSGPSPLCVEFTDISVIPNTFSTTRRLWSFGDGVSAISFGPTICHEYYGLANTFFDPSLSLSISEKILKLPFNQTGISAIDYSTYDRNYAWQIGIGGSDTLIPTMIPDSGHALSGVSGTGYFFSPVTSATTMSVSAALGIGASLSGICAKDLVFKFVGSFPKLGTSATEIIHIKENSNFIKFTVRSTGVLEFRWASSTNDITFVTPAIAVSGSPTDSLSIQTIIFNLYNSGLGGQFYYGKVTGNLNAVSTSIIASDITIPSDANVIGLSSSLNISHLEIESGIMNLQLAQDFHNRTVRGI